MRIHIWHQRLGIQFSKYSSHLLSVKNDIRGPLDKQILQKNSNFMLEKLFMKHRNKPKYHIWIRERLLLSLDFVFILIKERWRTSVTPGPKWAKKGLSPTPIGCRPQLVISHLLFKPVNEILSPVLLHPFSNVEMRIYRPLLATQNKKLSNYTCLQ